MEEIKKTVSESQKKAQKKYDQKTKMVSIKYTPADMEKYERLQKRLKGFSISTNKFVKEVVDDYICSGYSKRDKPHKTIQEKLWVEDWYYAFKEVDDEKVKKLKKAFGEEIVGKILDDYQQEMKDALERRLFDCACEFEEWIDLVVEQKEEGEFSDESLEEIYKKLSKDMWRTIESM